MPSLATARLGRLDARQREADSGRARLSPVCSSRSIPSPSPCRTFQVGSRRITCSRSCSTMGSTAPRSAPSWRRRGSRPACTTRRSTASASTTTASTLPITEDYARRAVTLPLFPTITEEQIGLVVEGSCLVAVRILLVSQYFTPEITVAAAARLHGFRGGAGAAREPGVEVICEVPSHPAGVVEPRVRGSLRRDPPDGWGSRCVTCGFNAKRRQRQRGRGLLNYASLGVSAILAGRAPPQARRDRRLLAAPPGQECRGRPAFRHRAPWVLDVRDLWPDVALVVGEVEEGPLASAAREIEHRLYRSCRRDHVHHRSRSSPQVEARGGEGKVTQISERHRPSVS